MQVIVGLGNPGDEYAHTRHNAGFEVIDLLAQRWGVSYWKNACGAMVGEAKVRQSDGSIEKVILAKPQSFMNLSGGPVSHLCREYDEQPSELIVIHDELDIPAGSVRVKKGGGHAGPVSYTHLAVAGTATSVVSIEKRMEVYDSSQVHNTVVPRETLERIFNNLCSMSLEQRKGVVGLEPARASVIVAVSYTHLRL